MENSGELHRFGLFVDRVDDAVFALCDPKAGEPSVGKMSELFGVWWTGGAAETENLEEDLAKAFRGAGAEVPEGVENGL